MLFKTPEKLVLTEQNVGYLAQVCETHKQVLNLKPIFLKRISNLQSEIDSILHVETERTGNTDIDGRSEIKLDSNRPPSDDIWKEPKIESVSNSRGECAVSEMDEMSKKKTTDSENLGTESSEIKVDQGTAEERSSIEFDDSQDKESTRDVFSILEDAEKMVNEELESYSGTNKLTHHKPEENPFSTRQNEPLRSESPASQMDILESPASQMDNPESLASQMDNSESLASQMDNSESLASQMDNSESPTSHVKISTPIDDNEPVLSITDQDIKNGPFLTSKTISLRSRKETSAFQDITTQNGDSQRTKLSAKDDTTVSVCTDSASNTTTIRETRQKEVVVTRTTYARERDPKLFVRIVSPKQRIVTRYKSYSPEVSSSPDFANIDRVGEAAKNLMSS